MAKNKVYSKALPILFCIFILTAPAQSLQEPDLKIESELLEFSLKSDKTIAGQYPALDISFSSVMETQDYVVVAVQVGNTNQLIARINYGDGTQEIQFISLETGQPVRPSEQDLGTLRELSSVLAEHISIPHRGGGAVDALLSTLSLSYVYAARESESSDVSNEAQGVVPQVWTSLCGAIGSTVVGTYTLSWPAVRNRAACEALEGCSWDLATGICTCTESAVVGPCSSGDCFGRCGSECDGNPNNPVEVQRFTQECFNHDLCCRRILELGLDRKWCFGPVGPCGGEWLAAADGYINATNCNAIEDDWTIQVSGESWFEGQVFYPSFAQVYHFSQRRQAFRGNSDPNPDDRFSTFAGMFTNASEISGSPPTGGWRFPTYMGADCDYKPCGYASGGFTGTTGCGDPIPMDLEGRWGWYYLAPDCTFAGYGSFVGNGTATKGVLDLDIGDNLEKRTETNGRVAPALPHEFLK